MRLQLDFNTAQRLHNNLRALENNEPQIWDISDIRILETLVDEALAIDMSSEFRSLVNKYIKTITDVEAVDWNQQKEELIFYSTAKHLVVDTSEIDTPLVKAITVTHMSFRTGQHTPVWYKGKFIEFGR